MIPNFGPVELILILVIVTMLFGVGKLPEVFGSVGRGIREFRRNSADPVDDKDEDEKDEKEVKAESAPVAASETPVSESKQGS